MAERPPPTRAHRAHQTHEVDILMELFRQSQLAAKSGDFAPVEALVHPDAVLRTRKGDSRGREAVVAHLKHMFKQRLRIDIVAPKGGLMTVLVAPVTFEGVPVDRGHEQVYHIMHDRLIELIDLGRTPQQVYRPESQPN